MSYPVPRVIPSAEIAPVTIFENSRRDALFQTAQASVSALVLSQERDAPLGPLDTSENAAPGTGTPAAPLPPLFTLPLDSLPRLPEAFPQPGTLLDSPPTLRSQPPSHPAHLSEFYALLLGVSPPSTPPPPRFLRRRSSETTSHSVGGPSVLDLPTLITTTDVAATKHAFEALLAQAARYREALLLVSEAASGFALALEETARCKGSGVAAEGLMMAGGLHHLVANHQQLLARSINTSFEVPVRSEVETYSTAVRKSEEQFRATIRAKHTALRAREKANIRSSKQKSRNLAQYRLTLTALTAQVDEIDRLKHDYYLSSFEIVERATERVLSRTGSVVRAEVELYEGIARKGWSGGGLDDLIAQCPDPFETETETEAEEETEEAVHEEPLSHQVRLLNTSLGSIDLGPEPSSPHPTITEASKSRRSSTTSEADNSFFLG